MAASMFSMSTMVSASAETIMVVGQFVISKLAALAVFEPLGANLIAADMEFPNFFWNTVKILRGVNPDAPSGFDCGSV